MSPRPSKLNSHQSKLPIHLKILIIALLLFWDQALAFQRLLSTNWRPNQKAKQYYESLPPSFCQFRAEQ